MLHLVAEERVDGISQIMGYNMKVLTRLFFIFGKFSSAAPSMYCENSSNMTKILQKNEETQC